MSDKFKFEDLSAAVAQLTEHIDGKHARVLEGVLQDACTTLFGFPEVCVELRAALAMVAHDVRWDQSSSGVSACHAALVELLTTVDLLTGSLDDVYRQMCEVRDALEDQMRKAEQAWVEYYSPSPADTSEEG